MVSLSRDSTGIPMQDYTQSVPPKKVVPAIPLSYIRKRTKHQTERTIARHGVEITTAVITKKPREIGRERPLSIAFSPENISDDVVACDQKVGVFDSASLTAVETKLQKGEGDTRHDISFDSDHQNLSMKVQETKDDMVLKEEIIHSRHGSSKADDKDTHQSKFVPTGNESYESKLTHQTPSDVIPATLLQPDGIILESARFPSRQILGTSPTHQNENFIICDNSQSSKSSPTAPQSVLYPQPSISHIPSPHTHPATYPSNSQNSRNSPHIYSPNSHIASSKYYIHTNGIINATPVNEVIGESIIPIRNSKEYSPIVTPVESCLGYNSEITMNFYESKYPPNDRNTSTPLKNQNSAEIMSNNTESCMDDAKVLREESSVDSNCNHYSQLPPILGNFGPQPDVFDGLIEYLSSQFADPTFADSKLELHYSDDRETSIRIPGHSLIFARSITLREMMSAMCSDTTGINSKTLLIETNDRFLCNIGFYMAMHRLYGNPLLDVGPLYLGGSAMQYQLPSVSTVSERFNLALGYAAAGHLLKMHVVVSRGCEIAGLLLNWVTLEKALDFALDGGLEPHWMTQSCSPAIPRATYGPSVNMIIQKVIEFICLNFPQKFELDVSVGEGNFALRLPKIQDQSLPLINPRLCHIKFGDHATEEPKKSEAHQSPTIILSRILISLPWDLLRCIFESSRLANHYGSMNISHHLLCKIILEREKRRLLVYNSSVPNSERNKKYQEWLSVGWREEVEPLCQDERYPKLNRNWTDFNVPET